MDGKNSLSNYDRKEQSNMPRVDGSFQLTTTTKDERVTKKELSSGEGEVCEKMDLEPIVPVESLSNSAIKISLVADAILSRVNFFDLRRLRLVNKVWSTAASNELIKRNSSRILSFHVGYDSPTNNIVLKKLNQLLKNRTNIFSPTSEGVNNNFPCTRFKMDGLLGSPHIQKLFNLHGQVIKVLELNFPSRRYAKLRRPNLKLFQLIPNIVELYLDAADFPCHLWEELKFPYLLIFNGGHYPSDVSVDARSSLAYKILTGSPNLEKVLQVKFQHVEFFIMAGKVHLITELHMNISSDQDLNKIEKLADTQPKLKIMSIKCCYIQDWTSRNIKISRDLTKILESSQDTLEELWMTPFLGNLENLKIPQLNNLKRLKLYGNATRVKDENDGKFRIIRSTPTRILPLGLDPNWTFPILRTVTLVSMDYSFDIMNKYFPFNEPPKFKFAGVDFVQIHIEKRKPSSAVAFARLRDWFPNLKGITLNGCPTLQNWTDIFSIWQGPQLEQLEVELPKGQIKLFALDPVLTGINEDICEQLRSLTGFDLVANVVNLRSQPSIIDLTGLKCFKIIKRHYQTKTALISKVTKLYAFYMMPMLKYTESCK